VPKCWVVVELKSVEVLVVTPRFCTGQLPKHPKRENMSDIEYLVNRLSKNLGCILLTTIREMLQVAARWWRQVGPSLRNVMKK
jgi:hypothetical protein